MGPNFADYQQAQIQAARYAASHRQIKRYSFRYLVASVASLTFTAILAPEFLLPSLLFAVGGYVLYRYASAAYTKLKHLYLDWRASRHRTEEDGISLEPLLATESPRVNLRNCANVPISQAIIKKSAGIEHYAHDATFVDHEPMRYADRKHQRALFQYHMLELGKEAALKGDKTFIDEFIADKNYRRGHKADILKQILDEYMIKKGVTLTIEHVEESGEYGCKISGEKDALIRMLEEWNRSTTPTAPFISVPAGLTKEGKEDFYSNTLLPLLLDADKLCKIEKKPSRWSRRANIFKTYQFKVTQPYIQDRITHLEQANPNPFYGAP